MFDVVATVDGQRRSTRPLTLLGAHGADRASEAAGAGDVLADVKRLEQYAREAWGEDAPGPALLARVMREAVASDVLGRGNTGGFIGPIPSPLAPARPDGFGAFQANQAFLDELEPDIVRLAVGEPTFNGTPDVSLHIENSVAGALVFTSDAMIVALPPYAEAVSVRYTPDDGFQTREFDDALARVTAPVRRPGRAMLLWRAYQGENTLEVDGVSDLARRGWHRITLAPLRGTVLVARVVFAAHRLLRRESGDLTFKKRRPGAELADTDTASDCPDLGASSALKLDAAVVAVHGTMASAVPLAAALRLRAGPTPVVRFEHDTWLAVADNARDLAHRLADLGARDMLLVGHSRGGLVARHAAELVAQAGSPPRVHVVTLGTPFKGSPHVGPSGTALLGARALLGMVRLGSGAVGIDLTTYVAGLLIRGRLPRGIAAMDPGSDYLAAFAHRPPTETTTVAGAIDPAGPVEANTVGFLRGIAKTAFGGQPNDLVVSEDSARGECADTLTVEADHFSYWQNRKVLDRIVQRMPVPDPIRKRGPLESQDEILTW